MLLEVVIWEEGGTSINFNGKACIIHTIINYICFLIQILYFFLLCKTVILVYYLTELSSFRDLAVLVGRSTENPIQSVPEECQFFRWDMGNGGRLLRNYIWWWFQSFELLMKFTDISLYININCNVWCYDSSLLEKTVMWCLIVTRMIFVFLFFCLVKSVP